MGVLSGMQLGKLAAGRLQPCKKCRTVHSVKSVLYNCTISSHHMSFSSNFRSSNPLVSLIQVSESDYVDCEDGGPFWTASRIGWQVWQSNNTKQNRERLQNCRFSWPLGCICWDQTWDNSWDMGIQWLTTNQIKYTVLYRIIQYLHK